MLWGNVVLWGCGAVGQCGGPKSIERLVPGRAAELEAVLIERRVMATNSLYQYQRLYSMCNIGTLK